MVEGAPNLGGHNRTGESMKAIKARTKPHQGDSGIQGNQRGSGGQQGGPATPMMDPSSLNVNYYTSECTPVTCVRLFCILREVLHFLPRIQGIPESPYCTFDIDDTCGNLHW